MVVLSALQSFISRWLVRSYKKQIKYEKCSHLSVNVTVIWSSWLAQPTLTSLQYAKRKQFWCENTAYDRVRDTAALQQWHPDWLNKCSIQRKYSKHSQGSIEITYYQSRSTLDTYQ